MLLDNGMGAAIRIDRNLGAIWRKCLDLVKMLHLDPGVEYSHTFRTSAESEVRMRMSTS